MNRKYAVVALLISALALFLPTRTQTFTRATVDGRTMRVLVAGSGDTTVVLEGGLGAPLETWGKVQPRVSRFARTVAYDRAGNGLSQEGPRPRDGRQVASELRHALRSAGIAPPYLLVGHSLGGLYIRVFAAMYPDDVRAMVLVDPTQDALDAEGFEHSVIPELNALRATIEQARPQPPAVPVVLIDAVGPREPPFATAAFRELRSKRRSEVEAESRAYATWVKTVPGARIVVSERSGHNVPQEEPEVVVDTIREVVQQMAAP